MIGRKLKRVVSGYVLADNRRPKNFTEEQYFKTQNQMAALFADIPEALVNSVEIAKRCNLALSLGKNFLPQFPTPNGESLDDYLVIKAKEGLAKRSEVLYPDPQQRAEKTPEYEARLTFETGIIIQMGFPGYFLVVADLVGHAKRTGIRVGSGRGSAAGSLVAYALGITGLDPIEHGLLFERFLNPERISMPDIDLDFDERRRSEMIKYATEKYGEDRVAQIITYGTIKSKQSIKDSTRVLGYPYAVGEKLTKALPPAIMGKDISLAGVFDSKDPRHSEASEFRALYESDPDSKRVVDTALIVTGKQIGRAHV